MRFSLVSFRVATALLIAPENSGIFRHMMSDRIAFEELKAHAPAEWSFSSAEETEEPDEADWWKVTQ
jgi:hypothetical protein